MGGAGVRWTPAPLEGKANEPASCRKKRTVIPAPTNGNVPAYYLTMDDVGIVPYEKRIGNAV